MKRKALYLFIILLLSFGCESKPDKKEFKTPEVIKYKKEFTNDLGMKFVYIKPGTFLMGTDYKLHYSGREDEVQHKVTLTKPFYMQTTETTIGQWKQFIKETKYITQAEKDGFSWYCGGYRYRSEKKKGYTWKNPGYKYNDKFPVNNVSRDDSLFFLKWLSKKEGVTYRLPTEAEWEYSCRAGTTTHFPGGNLIGDWENTEIDETLNPQLDKIAWYCLNSGINPHQVALKKPNPWGLYDILGNVEEFCQDEFFREYPKKHMTDPVFSSDFYEEFKMWVIRGGGTHKAQWHVTSSMRDGHSSYISKNVIGFRVVKDVEEKDIVIKNKDSKISK